MLASVPAPFRTPALPKHRPSSSLDLDSPFSSISSPHLSLQHSSRLIDRHSIISVKNKRIPPPSYRTGIIQDNRRAPYEYPLPLPPVPQQDPWSSSDRHAASLSSRNSLLRPRNQCAPVTGFSQRAEPHALADLHSGRSGFEVGGDQRKIISMQHDMRKLVTEVGTIMEWEKNSKNALEEEYSEASDEEGDVGVGLIMSQRSESVLKRLMRRKDRVVQDDGLPLRGSILCVKPPTIKERLGFGGGFVQERQSGDPGRGKRRWFMISMFRRNRYEG